MSIQRGIVSHAETEVHRVAVGLKVVELVRHVGGGYGPTAGILGEKVRKIIGAITKETRLGSTIRSWTRHSRARSGIRTAHNDGSEYQTN
jgi:hypothetical protein